MFDISSGGYLPRQQSERFCIFLYRVSVCDAFLSGPSPKLQHERHSAHLLEARARAPIPHTLFVTIKITRSLFGMTSIRYQELAQELLRHGSAANINRDGLAPEDRNWAQFNDEKWGLAGVFNLPDFGLILV